MDNFRSFEGYSLESRRPHNDGHCLGNPSALIGQRTAQVRVHCDIGTWKFWREYRSPLNVGRVFLRGKIETDRKCVLITGLLNFSSRLRICYTSKVFTFPRIGNVISIRVVEQRDIHVVSVNWI